MLDDLVFTENAYFYHKIKGISKTKIDKLFTETSRKKEGNYILKDIKKRSNGGLTYSICIFKFSEKPSFINSSLLKETKFAYLLVVEYKDFIVINKKSITGLDKELKEYIEEIDYNIISKLFLVEDTNFEKMSLYNMDISNNVVRRKSMEAINLRESMSALGVNKYMVNQLRLSNKGGKFSLSLNNSKIIQLGKKVDLELYLGWVKDICDRIENFVDSETFIDSFSSPLPFTEYIDNIQPRSCLFLTSDIESKLENGEITSVSYFGKELNIFRYLKRYQKTLDIELKKIKEKTHPFILNKFDKSLKLRINKNSMSVQSTILKNIVLTFNTGEEQDLLSFINQTNAFIVSFEEVEVIYWNKKLFKDNRLIKNISYFLKAFKSYNRLSNISSEKGQCTIETSEFSNDSLFYFVEKHLTANSDYVLCDDLGNEWADYISIKSHETISFFHAKHGEKGMSASKFHEVISQAQKNLGNIFATEKELNRKRQKWDRLYMLKDYPNSNIKRLRKGANTRYATEMYLKTLFAPNSRKEVFLVVDFISFTELKRELQKLQKGQRAQNEAVQILWLISSFVLACKEVNVDAYITCLP
jgi:hypothetical protein